MSATEVRAARNALDLRTQLGPSVPKYKEVWKLAGNVGGGDELSALPEGLSQIRRKGRASFLAPPPPLLPGPSVSSPVLWAC